MIVGVFAVSEVMLNIEVSAKAVSLVGIRNLMPTWGDINRCSGAMVRSTGVGFFLGLLPGCAPSVTTFVAYDLEKRVSKHPDRFGKGAIEGVAAPEGANNATSTAGFVPLFSFGLPAAPSMAVFLGVLGTRTLRRTKKLRLRPEPLRLPGGTAISMISLRRLVRNAG